MNKLYQHSVQLLLQTQAPNGAFPASTVFTVYRYCWLRDGTFIAHALDKSGEHAAAGRFFQWVDMAIRKHLAKLNQLFLKHQNGEPIGKDDFLHTRFTLDGDEGTEEWGNFQLDGYGAYLWGVAEHIRLTGDDSFLMKVHRSIEETIRYLTTFWHVPNHDCWEEFGDRVHPSTLAAVFGGLQAIYRYVPVVQIPRTLSAIREALQEHGVQNGRFVKSFGNPSIDANLLWLSVPYKVVPPNGHIMVRTVEEIEHRLVTGGVHRYPEDSFYGGGAWVLLTAWLGWYYAEAGNLQRAKELLAWVEAQADDQGNLPEQVQESLFFPEKYQEWVDRWGEPAKPLLWSHAMYLILAKRLQELAG
ncbi:glycoside hydrolase family 15 protein [Effusibacillus pohliae]|uniref:glycoside hydrolase family 15 protein n=1 Tax=Effusibacillus pohliae TaxID=232270 RepID=UPI0003618081|nr:glycoside hydrolase family 15 protein [Effusibacillus pohliae]